MVCDSFITYKHMLYMLNSTPERATARTISVAAMSNVQKISEIQPIIVVNWHKHQSLAANKWKQRKHLEWDHDTANAFSQPLNTWTGVQSFPPGQNTAMGSTKRRSLGNR